jgi:hypothetical protein
LINRAPESTRGLGCTVVHHPEIEVVSSSCFKTCSCCGQEWPTRGGFLSDATLQVVGYQADFRQLRLGLFLFNHTRCRTTLGVHAQEFVDLYPGPVFESRRTGTDECPGYCLHPDELARCPVECECAFVREVLQVICTRLPADSRLELAGSRSSATPREDATPGRRPVTRPCSET